ncbi:13915_t:CDS:2, partial [Acaulospora morrowiae]
NYALFNKQHYYFIQRALKTIFPQASTEEITKYEKQLSSVKNLDPVLIISPNQAWINQHGANMRILVVSFTSQPSPNSILYATIFALFVQTPSSFPLSSKLDTLMLNCTLLERRGYYQKWEYAIVISGKMIFSFIPLEENSTRISEIPIILY